RRAAFDHHVELGWVRSEPGNPGKRNYPHAWTAVNDASLPASKPGTPAAAIGTGKQPLGSVPRFWRAYRQKGRYARDANCSSGGKDSRGTEERSRTCISGCSACHIIVCPPPALGGITTGGAAGPGRHPARP